VTSLGRCVEYISEKPLMALNKAIETAGPDGLVVITGSLFLAAELRESLLNIPYNQKPEHA
jgi:folylpolyglutamate synthase/dihydropteroate synthase